jgi:hypothetical protein
MGSPSTPVPPPGSKDDNGQITNLCLGSHCWLGWGRKKDVPKGCRCELVGHYCGMYVWVLPGGRDELSKLTLAILDYALSTSSPPPQKEVTITLNKDGTISDTEHGPITVKATIPMDSPFPTELATRLAQIEHVELPAVGEKFLSSVPNKLKDKLRDKTFHNAADLPLLSNDDLKNLNEKEIKDYNDAKDEAKRRILALKAEVAALTNIPAPGPQRGPTLDELSLGVGYGALRSAVYQALPPAPRIR